MNEQRNPVEPEVSPQASPVEPAPAQAAVEPGVTLASGQVKPAKAAKVEHEEPPPENPGERVAWGIKVIRAGHKWNARQASRRAGNTVGEWLEPLIEIGLGLERGELKVVPTMTVGEVLPPGAQGGGRVRLDHDQGPSVDELRGAYELLARMAAARGATVGPKADRVVLQALAARTGLALPRTPFRRVKSDA
jgi:hypothetical protein